MRRCCSRLRGCATCPGLLVGSGDVVLTFDPVCLDWSQHGVTGVGLRQPLTVALQHGVYISDSAGRVYSFLQKPSEAQVVAAGGVLGAGDAALDLDCSTSIHRHANGWQIH